MGNTLGTYDVDALLARVAELEGEVAVLSRDNGQLSGRVAAAESDAAASEARAQAWERAHESLRADHDALERGATRQGVRDTSSVPLSRPPVTSPCHVRAYTVRVPLPLSSMSTQTKP